MGHRGALRLCVDAEDSAGAAFDTAAKIDPEGLRDAQEDLDDFGVELVTAATGDLKAGLGEVTSLAVGAIGSNGVEGIGDGEDARAERNLLSAKTARVAGAVVGFLMRVDDLGRLTQERDFAHHLIAAHAVLAHDGALVWSELAGLEQNTVGDGDLADVVQECAAGDDAELAGVDTDGACQRNGVCSDAAGVPFGLRVAKVKRVAHRFERDVITAFEVPHGGAKAAGARGDDGLKILAIFEIAALELAVVQGAV